MSGRRQLAVVLTAAGLALGLGACGSDDEPTTTSATEETASTTETTSSTPSTTDMTSSTTSTADSTSSTTSTEETTTPDDESGGGTGPRGDSEENDKAPAEGSPEASFEEFCDANPKQCG